MGVSSYGVTEEDRKGIAPGISGEGRVLRSVYGDSHANLYMC